MQDRWFEIKGNTGKSIGAVGVRGSNVICVLAYFEDYDANQDGTVSFGERAVGTLSGLSGALQGKALLEVVMQARFEPELMCDSDFVDSTFSTTYGRWARNAVANAVWAGYFKPVIGVAASRITAELGTGVVKSFAIKKGMEAVAKAMLDPVIEGALEAR